VCGEVVRAERTGEMKAKEIPAEVILDLVQKGYTANEMAEYVGAGRTTIKKRIVELQRSQATILEYRKLQNIHLTQLQHDILDQITEDKIACAGLGELTKAYEILKKAELVDQGKPSEIKGLVGYLLKIEEEESAAKSVYSALSSDDDDTIDGKLADALPDL
jgi:hypothetical protein